MSAITITNNYFADLNAAVEAGLFTRNDKNPKKAELYAAIEKHNAAIPAEACEAIAEVESMITIEEIRKAFAQKNYRLRRVDNGYRSPYYSISHAIGITTNISFTDDEFQDAMEWIKDAPEGTPHPWAGVFDEVAQIDDRFNSSQASLTTPLPEGEGILGSLG